MVKKGRQTLTLIFSKEVLIFGKSISVNVALGLDRSSSSSPEVYQCCISKSNNSGFKKSLKFLTSPSLILDLIMKLKGGSYELTDEEMEKLVNRILAKAPQSSHKEISINKFLKKILKVIEPVISDQIFYRILRESQKP